jgi:hypothetical protein
MGAAAIAARIQRPRVVRRDRAMAPALAFDELGGPLVAVCALAGGAGASTLALLLARQAAASSAAPVLLTEADPLRGGLAAITGHAAPHPLVELAQRVAEDAAPAETFLELEPGLRLVAAAPRRCETPHPEAVRALLGEARAAHGLVIVDCGTTWAADNPTLSAATHILWCVSATPGGLAQLRLVLDSDVLPPAGRCAELLVATAQGVGPRVSVRSLRRLAGERGDRLVLIPHSDAAARGERVADEALAHAVSGIVTALRRRR